MYSFTIRRTTKEQGGMGMGIPLPRNFSIRFEFPVFAVLYSALFTTLSRASLERLGIFMISSRKEKNGSKHSGCHCRSLSTYVTLFLMTPPDPSRVRFRQKLRDIRVVTRASKYVLINPKALMRTRAKADCGPAAL